MSIEAVSADQVTQMGDLELLAVVRESTEMANRAAAIRMLAVAETHARSQGCSSDTSLARELGYQRSNTLVRDVTGDALSTVNRWVKIAAAITSHTTLTGQMIGPKVDHVADALLSGKLSLDSAGHIVEMVLSLTFVDPDKVDAAVRSLIQAATCLDMGAGEVPPVPLHADKIRGLCRQWHQRLDPDGAMPLDGELSHKRGITLGEMTKDRLVPITGRLDPEIAALLAKVFDAHNSPAAGAKYTTPGGVDAGQLADTRTAPQRRHDIFASMITVAARSEGTPFTGGAPVTVMIQIKEENLESGKGLLHGHDGDLHPITTTHHATCAGATQKIWQDDTGKITKLGTLQRVFNASQRRAITIRDGGCVIPGCTIPPPWCEIHHVTEHSRGGPTHTNNGVLLCFYHHRSLETNGWHITMNNGIPHTRPPQWLHNLHNHHTTAA